MHGTMRGMLFDGIADPERYLVMRKSGWERIDDLRKNFAQPENPGGGFLVPGGYPAHFLIRPALRHEARVRFSRITEEDQGPVWRRSLRQAELGR